MAIRRVRKRWKARRNMAKQPPQSFTPRLASALGAVGGVQAAALVHA